MQFCSFAEKQVGAYPGFMDDRGGIPPYLEVMWARPAERLPALLSALRPGGVPVLQAVQLADIYELDAAALEPCPELSAVTELRLSNCEALGSWEEVMAALLRQAPLLSSLHVSDYESFHELPACVVAHTGLRRLLLSCGSMDALPVGPYLAGLQWLSCPGWWLADLLPALADATALTGLEPRGSVTEAVLSALPPLQQLKLERCSLQQLPVWPGMSALRSLSLRSAKLPTNKTEQLGALLSSLPLLETLDLGDTSLTELPEQLPTGKCAVHCAAV